MISWFVILNVYLLLTVVLVVAVAENVSTPIWKASLSLWYIHMPQVLCCSINFRTAPLTMFSKPLASQRPILV